MSSLPFRARLENVCPNSPGLLPFLPLSPHPVSNPFPTQAPETLLLSPPTASKLLSQTESFQFLFIFYFSTTYELVWPSKIFWSLPLWNSFFPWPLGHHPFLIFLWPLFLSLLCSFLSSFGRARKKSKNQISLIKLALIFLYYSSPYCDYHQQQNNHQPFRTQTWWEEGKKILKCIMKM